MSKISRFAFAFEKVLSKDLDRGILVSLHEAGKELRYEELRRVLGSPHPQKFQDSLDRLMRLACLARRLEPVKEYHRAYYRPTSRGHEIASIFIQLAQEGGFPTDLKPDHLNDAKRVLLGKSVAEPGPLTA